MALDATIDALTVQFVLVAVSLLPGKTLNAIPWKNMQMSISLSLIIFTGCANNRNQQTCTLQVHGPPSCVSGFTTANFLSWSYCAVVVVGQQVVVVVDQLEHQKLEACPSDMS